MSPEHYWKAKALELERAILEQNINQAIKTFEPRLAEGFGAAGLDPQQRYQFDDDAMTATPVKPQGPQLAVDNTSEV